MQKVGASFNTHNTHTHTHTHTHKHTHTHTHTHTHLRELGGNFQFLVDSWLHALKISDQVHSLLPKHLCICDTSCVCVCGVCRASENTTSFHFYPRTHWFVEERVCVVCV